MPGGLSRSSSGDLNVGFVFAVAALAVSVQVVGALALAGAVDAGEWKDAVEEFTDPNVVAGSCVMVYPFDLPWCLPWNCHCISIPSCTCG